MCNCISEVDEKLKERGCALDTPFLIPREANAPMPPQKVAVKTYRLDYNKRKQPVLLVASYCPFCGEAYDGEKQSQPAAIAPVYTAAVGDAAETYLARFPYAHPLPAQWRWSELFDVMLAASSKRQAETAPVTTCPVCNEVPMADGNACGRCGDYIPEATKT